MSSALRTVIRRTESWSVRYSATVVATQAALAIGLTQTDCSGTPKREKRYFYGACVAVLAGAALVACKQLSRGRIVELRLDEARGLVHILSRPWYTPNGAMVIEKEVSSLRVSYNELDRATNTRIAVRARPLDVKAKHRQGADLRITAGDEVYSVDSLECDVFDTLTIRRIAKNADEN